MLESNLITTIMFYLFAGILILSVVFSIFSKKILYSILWAISAFLCTSGIFYLLGNEYNSVVQFMIYCTVVPILLSFAVMFTDYHKDKHLYITQKPRLYASFFAIGLCVSLILFILKLTGTDISYFDMQTQPTDNIQNLISITKDIFLKYMYAFELLALIVLIIAAGVSNHDE